MACHFLFVVNAHFQVQHRKLSKTFRKPFQNVSEQIETERDRRVLMF